MSSSIRPPGTPPPASTGLGAAGEVAGGAEQVQQGAGARVQPSGAGSSQAGALESPGAEWLRRLDAGEISRSQAIDGLVAQALEAQGGARLSAAQRSELAEVLRQALLGDPVLGSLLGE
ncbi:MAG TPA: hypothetical protein VFZ61_05515 [Polyangiales bacterium]